MNLIQYFIAVLILSLGWYGFHRGLASDFLALFPFFCFGATLIHLGWGIYARKIDIHFFHNPFNRKKLSQWCVLSNKCLFYFLLTLVIMDSLVKNQYGGTYIYALVIAMIFLVLTGMIPLKKKSYVMDVLMLVGSVVLITGFYRFRIIPPLEQSVVVAPPFAKQFFILHGGQSILYNSMLRNPARRDAIYIVVSAAKFRQKHPDPDLQHFTETFGQPVVSPTAGMIKKVKNDIPDTNIAGKEGSDLPQGNFLVIEMDQDHFIMLAHLRQYSIVVKEGDQVEEGQLLAQCGRSGFVTEPALYMHIQNKPTPYGDNVFSYPIRFKKVKRAEYGNNFNECPVYPRRNDYLIPVDVSIAGNR